MSGQGISRSNGTEVPSPEQLKLSLSAKTKHLLHEPVIVTYTLTNPTQFQIESQIRFGPLFSCNDIKVTIQAKNEEPIPFKSGETICGEFWFRRVADHPQAYAVDGGVYDHS